ncbi:MAG: 2-C-methyl-D-erythritol 4-phosphate cytidylyltransferase [Actinomycetota bacterium]
MRAAAILLAAGRGERLGGDVPKGFIELDGRPLLTYSVEAVRACSQIDSVAVAVPVGYEDRAFEIAGPRGVDVVLGGASRQSSVESSLSIVLSDLSPLPEAVVVHDVARPLATTELFDRVLDALEGADGVVPALPVVDTIKRVDDGVVTDTLRRDSLVAVQTPQAFRTQALERAHAAARREGVEATDDAALIERIGGRVVVVAGDPRNIKITRPEDLRLASLLARGDG